MPRAGFGGAGFGGAGFGAPFFSGSFFSLRETVLTVFITNPYQFKGTVLPASGGLEKVRRGRPARPSYL
jgi:hypothetical protein